MVEPQNITAGAKVRWVQRRGERQAQRLWVKPWDAAVGTLVQVRALGPDWPWHSVQLVAREADIYVIAETEP